MTRDRRVRLEDIAGALGISRGTVDRALHNRPGVNPDVREKVIQVASDLGYSTNRAARSLALQRSITLGIVIPTEPRSYWGGVQEGFRSAVAELKDHGVHCVFFAQPVRDAAMELTLVRQALRSGVDGLALTPVNTQQMRQLIDETVDAGIPVVTFVTDIPDGKRLCFIGNDPLKEGRVAGEVLGKLIQGEGKVAIFRGIRGLHTDARCEGFRQVLTRDFPEATVVDEIELALPATLIRAKTVAVLQQNPDLKAMFVANAFVEFVAPVLEERGLSRSVCLVGFDLTESTEHHLRSGTVDAVISQNSFRQGYETLRILADHVLDGRVPPSRTVHGSVEVVFREMLS